MALVTITPAIVHTTSVPHTHTHPTKYINKEQLYFSNNRQFTGKEHSIVDIILTLLGTHNMIQFHNPCHNNSCTYIHCQCSTNTRPLLQ